MGDWEYNITAFPSSVGATWPSGDSDLVISNRASRPFLILSNEGGCLATVFQIDRKTGGGFVVPRPTKPYKKSYTNYYKFEDGH